MYVHNRVGTIMYGHKCLGTDMYIGTNVSGHKNVWAQTCLGTNKYGHKSVCHKWVWEQACGHKHVWAVGTVVWYPQPCSNQ